MREELDAVVIVGACFFALKFSMASLPISSRNATVLHRLLLSWCKSTTLCTKTEKTSHTRTSQRTPRSTRSGQFCKAINDSQELNKLGEKVRSDEQIWQPVTYLGDLHHVQRHEHSRDHDEFTLGYHFRHEEDIEQDRLDSLKGSDAFRYGD